MKICENIFNLFQNGFIPGYPYYYYPGYPYYYYPGYPYYFMGFYAGIPY